MGNIFGDNIDFLIIPINQVKHWMLIVVLLHRDDTQCNDIDVYYVDSLISNGLMKSITPPIEKFIKDEYSSRIRQNSNDNLDYTKIQIHAIPAPYQTNGSDCGLPPLSLLLMAKSMSLTLQ